MKFRLFKPRPFVTSPREFKLTDWKTALLATKDEISGNRLGILAAGIAYFMTFAFFPLIAASIAIAGLVLEPEQIRYIARDVSVYIPKDIADLLIDQLSTALENKSANLIVAVVALAVALFSISGAAQNTVNAANAAYGIDETRSFVKLRAAALMVTGIFFVAGAGIIGALLLSKPILVTAGVPSVVATVLSFLRWLILPIILSVALSLFYRYGPDHRAPKWQWVSWGSVIAAILWLLVTAGFFIYARFFAHFSESYGALAGLIVLMTWLNLSAFVVLLGAAVNHNLERQTLAVTKKRKRRTS